LLIKAHYILKKRYYLMIDNLYKKDANKRLY
jgi:hypothetical protein